MSMLPAIKSMRKKIYTIHKLKSYKYSLHTPYREISGRECSSNDTAMMIAHTHALYASLRCNYASWTFLIPSHTIPYTRCIARRMPPRCYGITSWLSAACAAVRSSRRKWYSDEKEINSTMESARLRLEKRRVT